MAIKEFDLDIERLVDIEALGWPERGSAREEGLGGNRLYADLRGFSWREAQRVLAIEEKIVARLQSSINFDDTLESIHQELDALYEADDDCLYGLDIGVASTVVALSAARCIPFSSCNGGCIEEPHQETYPLVAFFAKRDWISIIFASAEDANAGLYNSDGGVVVYGQIEGMLSFARSLITKRSAFRQLKSDRSTRDHVTTLCDHYAQISLPFSTARTE